MKKRFMICLAVLCAVVMTSFACADSITLNGTMIPAETSVVYAPVSGTADSVGMEAGQKVGAGDILYTMKTQKVYADRDGKVSGIFAQPGDDAETVATQYGAVLYIEDDAAYTVSGTTAKAYNSMETKIVHPGETVYAVSPSNNSRSGKGFISAVSGTGYTIEITEGTFLNSESVAVFRTEDYAYETLLGYGTVSRKDPVAVTATGAIVKIAVEDGAEVKRGDLLMETLDGTYDAWGENSTEIRTEIDGVIGSISVQAGGNIEKGSVAAEIYPTNRMRVEAAIPEDYVNMVSEGDPVTIELTADINRHYEGTVVMVSAIAGETNEESGVTYRIVAEFTPDEAVRFGMSALLTAGKEDEQQETQEENPEQAEDGESEEKTGDESSEKKHRERPEGMPEWNGEGERPERPEGSRPGKSDGAEETSGETVEEETAEPAESTEGQ